jgi:hypothetical protein
VRTLYELFTADTPGNLPTLISVRAFRDEFIGREFAATKFSPAACLKDLRAHISRAPAELEPVEPVLRFEPDRARVLEEEEEEILSTLSDHQNLMDLPWPAFETLIRDLFNKWASTPILPDRHETAAWTASRSCNRQSSG